jgi:hypothetical protein
MMTPNPRRLPRLKHAERLVASGSIAGEPLPWRVAAPVIGALAVTAWVFVIAAAFGFWCAVQWAAS